MASDMLDLKAKLSLDSSDYESGLSKSSSSAHSFGQIVQGAFKAAAVAITAATTAVGKFALDSVKVGMAFDKSMSQVKATMGTISDDQIPGIQAAAEKLGVTLDGTASATDQAAQVLREFAMQEGATTAFTATQAADALNYMALAGYDVATSVEMLPNVLNLAAAGNFDLARASDMVTDTQTAFGISLDRTSQMVDEMAKAASTGNTSVEQLGDAFLVVGGLAQELNGGFVELSDGTTASVDGLQELEIALTAMANAGVKGSSAGTHMRNMLMKLASPTSEGTEALEAMGVAVFDAEGNMRSLADIFGDLDAAMSTMTQEEKIQTIGDLFNARDLSSAEALLNAVSQDWDAIGESILDSEGAAQQMAEVQLDNLAGDITLFKSALEGAQIVISDQLSPSLRSFVQFGTQAIGTLSTAFQEGGLDGAMEALGTILSDGLDMIIAGLPKFIKAGMKLLGALGQGIIDNLPTIIDAAIEIITMLVNGLVESLPALTTAAIQIILQLAAGLTEALPMLIPAIISMIPTIVNTLIENLPAIMEAGWQLTIAILTGIIDALPELLAAIPDLIIALVNTFIEHGPEMLAVGMELINQLWIAIQEAWEELKIAFGPLLEELWALILELWESIKTTTREKWDSIKQTLIDTWNTIKTTVTNTLTTIKLKITTIWNSIKTSVTTVLTSIRTTIITAWESIKTAITTAIGQVKTTVTTAFTNIEMAISTAWENVKTTILSVWENVQTSVSDSVNNIWATISTAFSGAWESVTDSFNGIKESITTALSDAWDSVSTTATSIWTTISDAFTGAWTSVTTIFGNIQSAISEKLWGAYYTVSNAIGWIRGLFDFEWSLPHISLPHFSWEWIDLGPGIISIPSISVSWYKKAYENPLLFGSPTVIPTASGFKGFGDGAGDEIVYGRANLMKDIREAVGGGDQNVVINVYATENQSVREIALEVSKVLTSDVNRRKASAF